MVPGPLTFHSNGYRLGRRIGIQEQERSAHARLLLITRSNRPSNPRTRGAVLFLFAKLGSQDDSDGTSDLLL